MNPKPVPREPRWCTLCGTGSLFTAADFELKGESDSIVSCSDHLGESAWHVLVAQTSRTFTVTALTVE